MEKKNEQEFDKDKYCWITRYYASILDGEVTVGKWVREWYKLLIENLDNGVYFFDKKKANRAIRFIESFVHHSEGPLAPQLMELSCWQKAFVSTLFGVLDSEGFINFREAILIMGRKNGKTLLASAISCYMTYGMGEYGSRCYIAAPKLMQAEICYNNILQTIKAEPELSKLSKKRRSDIYISSTNSSIQPLAFSEKKSDGLNISCGICDEISSWPSTQGLRFYEVLKSSCGARKQPLLLSISTSGYIDNGVYQELLARATNVILGKSEEKRLLPVMYMIDDIKKWDDMEELKKANPNLGVSVSENYLKEELAIAKVSFSKKAEFLCKYCNVKQNESTAWLRAEDVKEVFGEEIKPESLTNSYAVVGIDLSQSCDLTCATLVCEKNGILNVVSHFWMPNNRIKEKSEEDNMPYESYIAKGHLSGSGEAYVDYNDVFLWIEEWRRKYKCIPVVIGYDKYSAQYLVSELNRFGYKTMDIAQGQSLHSSIQELESRIKEKSINCGDNQLLKAHLLNCGLKTNNDKSQIVKISERSRIDGVASLLCAIAARRYNPNLKQQLKNERK